MAQSGSALEKRELLAWVASFLRVPSHPRLWGWGSRLCFMVTSRNKMGFAPSGRPEPLRGDVTTGGWRLSDGVVEKTPGPACWDNLWADPAAGESVSSPWQLALPHKGEASTCGVSQASQAVPRWLPRSFVRRRCRSFLNSFQSLPSVWTSLWLA